MILTCPDCATRYFVDDAKLPPGGRKVRCAACGHSWRAEADGEPLDLQAERPIAADALQAASVRPADALPKSFRAQQEARRKTRKAVAAGAIWAALAAVFVAVVGAGVIFRVQVVRMWPRTAGVYAALRLPVNPLGLSPEGVQATSGLRDGQAMLFVQGLERNVEGQVRPPAALRVSLYDGSGARVASQVVGVEGAPLKPGEARPFRAAFADPPISGAQVGVDFVWTPAVARTAAPHVVPPPYARSHVALRSAPVAAKLAEPLPPGSPYALPAAARPQSPG